MKLKKQKAKPKRKLKNDTKVERAIPKRNPK